MSLICGTGKAQDHPFVNCKARIKANKAKLFQFDSIPLLKVSIRSITIEYTLFIKEV